MVAAAELEAATERHVELAKVVKALLVGAAARLDLAKAEEHRSDSF